MLMPSATGYDARKSSFKPLKNTLVFSTLILLNSLIVKF